MKLKKYIKLAALLGVVSIAMFSAGCSSSGIPEKLDGKIVKDSEGNAYMVWHSFGDNVHLREIKGETSF